MKIIRALSFGCVAALVLAMLQACASVSTTSTTPAAQPQAAAPNAAGQQGDVAMQPDIEEVGLPVRFQTPSYMIKDVAGADEAMQAEAEIVIPVGADITSTTGPVALRDILKRLAALKNMNVSWSSDVDQYALVDVDIRAEDDFFKAIDNLLRQKDYYHEVQGNTIVVKYKETRKFHIAMPFLTSDYTTGVGGDVLGSSGASGNVQGNIQLTSSGNTFDIWENIRTNLDQVLEIWEEPVASSAAASDQGEDTENQAATTQTTRNVKAGKGYYSIDKPIGLITVTAPRPLLEKIETYLNNLKAELYKQISIEAKILEVTLEDTSNKGIDWSGMLRNKSIDFQMFGPNGLIYQPGTSQRVVSQVSLTNPFSMVLDFLETQGRTKVLANPKISVMNGQPALISVGKNKRYIDKVESSADEGVITYSVSTSDVMSGLGMSVVATILDDDEIILSMTPITSTLEEPIEYISFGGGNTVGLPAVSLREMSTTVKIKNNDILIVGGLIDSTEDKDDTKVPFLGDLPVVDKLFKNEAKTRTKKELVILLQPTIL